MSAGELLARLSTGCTQRLTIPGGSVPELTQSDIAMALSGAGPGATLLARVKYAHDRDRSTIYRLELQTWIATTDLAIEYNWPLDRGKNTLRPLAGLALDLHISPPLCRNCEGRGFSSTRRGVVRECPGCRGTGIGKVSAAHKARWIGVHRSTWTRQGWDERLDHVLMTLQNWDAEALRCVRRLTRRNKTG